MNQNLLKILIVALLITGCKYSERNVADGGYDFLPINLTDSIFPYYPVKNKIHPKDSFICAFYGTALLKAFEEPNISLRPSPKPLFRFIYECWKSRSYIITISENEIIIKEGLQENYLDMKKEELTKEEQMLLYVFEWRFPITKNDTCVPVIKKRNLDSLINLYPQLLNRSYYDTLVHRAYPYLKQPFKYTTTRKAISQNEFNELYNQVIRSGYWKMPFKMTCDNIPTDGCRYTIEANNGTKYKIVTSGSCDDITSSFDSICYKIVETAGLDDKIILNGSILKK